jgi:hypothetical protein
MIGSIVPDNLREPKPKPSKKPPAKQGEVVSGNELLTACHSCGGKLSTGLKCPFCGTRKVGV